MDIVIEDDRWVAVDLERFAQDAARGVFDRLGLDPETNEVACLACDDARIAELNVAFREKTGATNVLSWPSEERAADVPGGMPRPPEAGPDGTVELGDIAIAYETCLREAEAAGVPLADHATHLIVHGVLHLLGFDHMTEADARLMEGLEVEILGNLGLKNPYDREWRRPKAASGDGKDQ